MNSKMIFKHLLMAVSGLLALSLISAVHASNMLEDISFASIPGDKVQVVLKFSESAPEPGTFTIDSPARIALDFPDTGVALDRKRQTIGIGLARSVTAVAAGGRTRVVLNMVTLTKYSTEVDGNNVIVTIDEANVSHSTASLGRNSIKDIDFRLGDEGEGNIIISFSEQPKNVNLKQEFEKLVVEIENVSLPGDLERRLDVNDFNTPVSFIDTFASGKNIKMLVDTKGEFDHLGYQAGRTFTIEVKGLTKAQKAAKEKAKFGYSGERLSLNFQDIEVRAVLQLIADFTGKNMVTSDTVSGSITLRLKNVPWDQALAIILKTKGLGMREEGNVMRVAPAEELAAIEKQELEAKKQIADLLPLVTETVQLQFVPASAVIKLLDDMGANEASKNQASEYHRW
ncbi:MAG: AMIN domain-containing protein [gamma proteobacterium symbiont of Bathyaustriella thionipta]|nr:AMIN domain-containing protein [gamma proteobacterium symbiont of Bathyaustriella thionipta]MCU7948566.1 AMIN domain-containing protein [gamma proteobacterium symbiont of Bathyaustriella thionipta]MCU7954475.1 AMIN domain-containing protein [gamma proteobacterium symbiont of Bathyaustriella thionipta]MCU7955156.1 AMIN domain-containing protein [gamma proteobacterium symbiont of Bathyaustriella thionipta]MCU7968805.1 AMIN domain-containing protein [gamma proteobacterium symbiont of Bathyaustr